MSYSSLEGIRESIWMSSFFAKTLLMEAMSRVTLVAFCMASSICLFFAKTQHIWMMVAKSPMRASSAFLEEFFDGFIC